jgi:hypothetical protein
MRCGRYKACGGVRVGVGLMLRVASDFAWRRADGSLTSLTTVSCLVEYVIKSEDLPDGRRVNMMDRGQKGFDIIEYF